MYIGNVIPVEYQQRHSLDYWLILCLTRAEVSKCTILTTAAEDLNIYIAIILTGTALVI